ncbi:MAG TPA: hypothetical protein DFR83_23935, partial [Deltaproteobacteria bacterium]|nr:hypothetical protein [Deltaproteobacteria bacterium]
AILWTACGPRTAPTKAPKPAKNPTADQLFEHQIALAGGVNAVESIRNLVSTGAMERKAEGVTMPIVTVQVAPNRMHQTAELQGLGQFIEAYDGETAWSLNPITGPAIKDGAELAQTRRLADIHAMLHYAEHYPSRTLVGPIEFEGTPCWQVDATTDDGQARSFFFNRENGYLRGEKLEFISEMGALPTVISHLAYERFQGFPVATRQVTHLGNIEIVVTTSDVRYNVPEDNLPDFAPPPAVKALMDELNALPE